MILDRGNYFYEQWEVDRAERLNLSADLRALVKAFQEKLGGYEYGHWVKPPPQVVEQFID